MRRIKPGQFTLYTTKVVDSRSPPTRI